MTAQAKQFSPELIHLLSDILADPTTVFSRLSRMRPSLLFDRPLSPGTAFLSKAERHILERNRFEVARLLYEGCFRRLEHLPVRDRCVVLTRSLVDEAMWENDVRKILRAPRETVPEEREVLKDQAKRLGFGAREAGLALALEPTSEARFALVSMLRIESRPRECVSVTIDWYKREASANWQGVAASRVAEAYLAQGARQEALDWYRESATGRLPGRTAGFCWLIQALLMGQEPEIETSLGAIEETQEVSRPALKQFLDVVGEHYLASHDLRPWALGAAWKVIEKNRLAYAGEVLNALE